MESNIIGAIDRLSETLSPLASCDRTGPPDTEPVRSKGKVGLSDVPHNSGDVSVGVVDEEAMYQRFRTRLAKEAPTLLRVLTIESEIEVKVERATVEVSGDSLKGRVALLITEGYFDDGQTASAAYTELRRHGFSTAKPNVYKECDKFAAMGFLTNEANGYRAVPTAKKRIKTN